MTRTTLIMVVLAALSIVAAVVMRPGEVEAPTFEDTGEELFPDFSDPNAAASLEVKEYDEEQARVRGFAVKLEGGRWIIPSHNNYPADGTERMGKAAASFLGAAKDVVRSDNPDDHAKFGVLDPEVSSAEESGRGRRVTISDASGKALVDVIVGSDVPDRQGFKFVRYPGEDRVYASKLAPEISTQFTDWIEEDLLYLNQDEIVAVLSNSYSVDEQSGTVTDDNPMYFELDSSPAVGEDGQPVSEWRVAAPPVFGPDGQRIDPETYTGQAVLPAAAEIPEGKQLNASKLKQMLGAADRLKIVGVRPQPKQLNRIDLLSKGFFVAGDASSPRLFGNEGDLTLYARDGVIYKLYFGEVTYAQGEQLTAGGAEDAGEGEGPAEGENARANRYMFVTVGYDPRFDQDSEDPPAEGEVRGKARADQLAERFDRWFYVIPDSSFTQLHKLPEDFWKDAA